MVRKACTHSPQVEFISSGLGLEDPLGVGHDVAVPNMLVQIIKRITVVAVVSEAPLK